MVEMLIGVRYGYEYIIAPWQCSTYVAMQQTIRTSSIALAGAEESCPNLVVIYTVKKGWFSSAMYSHSHAR